MKPQKILLTHGDLDGAASTIILDAAFNFDNVHSGAYHRIDSFINAVPQSAMVVVADLSLTIEQYVKLRDRSKMVIIIDHHPDTSELLKIAKPGSVFFSESKAAAALSYEVVKPLIKDEALLKRLKVLAMIANEYDLYKEGTPLFELGYDLNQLFWDYKFDKFVQEFKNGLLQFSPLQAKRIKELRERIKQRLAQAEYFPIEYKEPTPLKVMICLPDFTSLNNDVPNYKPGFDVYFIVNRYNNATSISVRSKGPVVNSSCEAVHKKFPCSCSGGGGHELAAGINIVKDPPDSLLDIIGFVCEDIILKNKALFLKKRLTNFS
jgi:oligoribonuclease NrnB/cAMP/cGMP phosphodiesterase (DHH superfamily)